MNSLNEIEDVLVDVVDRLPPATVSFGRDTPSASIECELIDASDDDDNQCLLKVYIDIHKKQIHFTIARS